MNCVIEKEIFWCSSPAFFMLLCVFRCTPAPARGVGKPCWCNDTTSKAKTLCYRVWANILYLTSIIQFVYTFPFSWKNTILPLDFNVHFSSVQSLTRVRLFATPWTAACQASLSIINSWSLLRLMSIESVMPSNHLILGHPLLFPPSIFPSIRVFPNESVLHNRWPKYWSFSFSISPSNEYSGLISFRMHWLDLLAVQGTLRSLLQHHSSKASFLWPSPFFIVPTLTSIHDYWKNHSLD